LAYDFLVIKMVKIVAVLCDVCCLVDRNAVSYQRRCVRQRSLRLSVRRRARPGSQRPKTSV